MYCWPANPAQAEENTITGGACMHTKTLISKLKTVQQETILDTEHDFTEVSAYMENILRWLSTLGAKKLEMNSLLNIHIERPRETL